MPETATAIRRCILGLLCVNGVCLAWGDSRLICPGDSAFRGHTLVCQALLEHLAVPTIENRAGQRAWDCAVKRGHFLLCAMLEEEQHRRRQREPRLIFLIASRQKHNPIARSLTGNLLFDASAVRIIFGLAGFIPPVEPCAR